MPCRYSCHHQKRHWAADLPGGPPKETQGQVLFALQENYLKMMSGLLQPHQSAAPQPVEKKTGGGTEPETQAAGQGTLSQPWQTADFEGTLSRGSGRHFAAAASAALQQLSPPADVQVSSPRPCSQASRKSLLLALCLSELITPVPGSFLCCSRPLRGLEVQGHSHGGRETQPL